MPVVEDLGVAGAGETGVRSAGLRQRQATSDAAPLCGAKRGILRRRRLTASAVDPVMPQVDAARGRRDGAAGLRGAAVDTFWADGAHRDVASSWTI